MPEIGNNPGSPFVLPHGPTHEDDGSDEISVAGLAGQIVFVPYNGKIADITETDTNKHYLDLAAALSETREIIAVNLYCTRVSGTGVLKTYPNEGTGIGGIPQANDRPIFVIIAEGTQRLQYAQSVANDDFDVYCMGYVVEI